MAGEKHQVSAFASSKDCPAREIQSQKALARSYKVKMTLWEACVCVVYFGSWTKRTHLCHIEEMSHYQNLTTSIPWHKKSFYFEGGEVRIYYLSTLKYRSFFEKTHAVQTYILTLPVLNNIQSISYPYTNSGSEILPGYICKEHATMAAHPIQSLDPCIATDFGVGDWF